MIRTAFQFLSVALVLGVPCSSYALHLDANYCADPGFLGIAHHIGGDNGDLNGQALVCLDNHTPETPVPGTGPLIFEQRLTEIAITASHENAHLYGLVHGDGLQNRTTIMTGAYNGNDKLFSDDSRAKLDLLNDGEITVWLDFEAESTLDGFGDYNFLGFTEWATAEGRTPGQIPSDMQAIIAAIDTDYANIQGTNIVFTPTMPMMGPFQTVSFVSHVPEPSTWSAICGLSLVALAGYGRRRRGQRA